MTVFSTLHMLLSFLLGMSAATFYRTRPSGKRNERNADSQVKERTVLAVTILNKVIPDRDGYYLITRVEEIGILKGMKYFDFWVMEYDLEKKEVRHGAEEIELRLAENVIEKAENVPAVQEGTLGFNNGGILKVFNRP